MVTDFKDLNYWAIILGGSTGLGFATARKLAHHGMNIIIIHRDRRADIAEIEEAFEDIREQDVKFESFNVDATNAEKRGELIKEISEILGKEGKVRTLVHSISKGNLKPMTGEEPTLGNIDFQITIDAMAIGLYDWTKAISNLDFLQKTPGLFPLPVKVIKRHGPIMQRFRRLKLPWRLSPEVLPWNSLPTELGQIVFRRALPLPDLSR